MKRLDKVVPIDGTKIKGMTAALVKRQGNVCMYKRWDSVWEVFTPNIVPKGKTVFKKYYDEDTESYPNNENFGSTAFCFPNQKLADECYYNMVSNTGEQQENVVGT